MQKMNGSKILVEALKREGVEVIFGYPGGMAIPIFDALYGVKEIRVVLTRHEQAAVHMADGYARTTGKVGVVLVTSGPGATNTVTGIATANFDSSPIVCISGQVPTSMIGNDAFQEADVTGITNPITKHNYLVHDVKDLARTVKNSFLLAKTGRPGAIVLDLPKDVLLKEYHFEYDFEANIRGYKPHLEGNMGQLEKIAKLIENSKKPIMIVGGGAVISNSAEEINRLMETSSIPAVATLMGLGVVRYDSPLFLGMLGMHGTVGANKAIQSADLIIALGTRFEDRALSNFDKFAPNAKIIHVDIDSSSINKNKHVDIPVVGDLKIILKKMLPLLQKQERAEWTDYIKEVKKLAHFVPRDQKRLTAIEVFESVNKCVPDDTILVTDVGQHQMWAALYYKFQAPRTQITSGGFGTMGFGFPAAIGAKIANPDRPVLCIVGDGGFQMNIQELATAVIERVPLVVLIMNNGFLGMVRQWQELFNEKRYSSTCLLDCEFDNRSCEGNPEVCDAYLPDFVKVAEAYRSFGKRVFKKEELDDVLKEAFSGKRDRPYIIDVMTEREENVWPMVPSGKSLDEVLNGGNL